ncbi:acylneuraminate cytidylyltransferase [Novosphingobium marinum]|uniref:Lysophospholipase L1-like esterase n=1 Tax=Novosphingobium marinum TaxID=1514948 RepID=A0A7Y9XWJ1_9SPHN|nr:GDSL-type esterase/lipase family protein [Novosphingobium marinum]NYH94710.1 lysophospholipase L1-like esterase [Novosphingobium marinum]GGC37969.1 acylneuraminate cytidylyltransferase [Novosphingobium marinum]
MTRGIRIAILAIALVAVLVFVAMRNRDAPPPATVGMTDEPCAAEGGPVTGQPIDDWAGRCAYRAANAEVIASGKRPQVAMIGDSLTAFWDLPLVDAVNRGIGGQTSDQVLLRFSQDVVALRPEVVHILVGTNDIAGNTGPLAIDSYIANVGAMVDQARANGIEVVLATMPPASRFPWKPGVSPEPWLSRVNARLVEMARERNLVLADYNAVLKGGEAGFREELFDDGAHPNEAGYAAMEPVLRDAIAEALARAGER